MKDSIPENLKCAIWKNRVIEKKDNDYDITLCILCSKIISIPEIVRKRLKIEKNRCLVYANAHYGHKISEYNGGKVEEENLELICRDCNLKMGSKNMDSFLLEMDIYDDKIEYMNIDSGDKNECNGICVTGKKCRKRKLDDMDKCEIHKSQRTI